MVVESAYRGYRIEVVAVHVEGVWDAEVTIHQTLSEGTACVGRLTCRKPTAEIPEERGAACARQWVDRHGRGVGSRDAL